MATIGIQHYAVKGFVKVCIFVLECPSKLLKKHLYMIILHMCHDTSVLVCMISGDVHIPI